MVVPLSVTLLAAAPIESESYPVRSTPDSLAVNASAPLDEVSMMPLPSQAVAVENAPVAASALLLLINTVVLPSEPRLAKSIIPESISDRPLKVFVPLSVTLFDPSRTSSPAPESKLL